MLQRKRGFGSSVCDYAPLSALNLQWINTISSAILMLASGTSIPKSFLVPIFALQAPASIVSWIKGEYGVWTAFLALLLRLFFHIPAAVAVLSILVTIITGFCFTCTNELELPFNALLIVLVAPYQILNLRGKLEAVILSLTIAGYLSFQHFSQAGSLRKAFDQGSIVATICIICVLAVPILLLIGC